MTRDELEKVLATPTISAEQYAQIVGSNVMTVYGLLNSKKPADQIGKPDAIRVGRHWKIIAAPLRRRFGLDHPSA